MTDPRMAWVANRWAWSAWQDVNEGWGFIASNPPWIHTAVRVNPVAQEVPELDETRDTYFSPLVFRSPKRTNGMALPSMLLYADLDADYDRDALAQYPPTFQWETSPGNLQGIWMMTDYLEGDEWRMANQGLTYFMKADRGGWAQSKVLRVPESVNHKRGGVRVSTAIANTSKTLDSKTVQLFQAQAPALAVHADMPLPLSREAWKQLMQVAWVDLSLSLRALLLAKSTTLRGGRSMHLWLTAITLKQQGHSALTAFQLLSGVPLNKFRSRPEVLWRLVQQAYNRP